MTAPTNAEGATLTADEIRSALVGGILAACASGCGTGTARHWPAADGSYVPLHDRCVDRWLAEWREATDDGSKVVKRPKGRLTGAYARRAMARGQLVDAPVSRSVSRSSGSPYFRPGMAEGTPWVVVTETSNGRKVSINHDRGHAEATMSRDRLLAESGRPIDFSGRIAVGGLLVDPTGAVADSWGEPMELDAPPRWTPLYRVQGWTTCVGCSELLWPLRLIADDGHCRTCVESRETDDPRVWPAEPGEPPIVDRPERFGGPKRPKAARRNRQGD